MLYVVRRLPQDTPNRVSKQLSTETLYYCGCILAGHGQGYVAFIPIPGLPKPAASLAL